VLVEPTSQWYASAPALPKSSAAIPAIIPAKLSSLIEHASTLHSSAISAYQSKSSSTITSSNSEFSFLQKILQSGTLSDRLSALTLMVQSSPLHNVKALETLKSMAERGKGKGGREESLKALRCIVDWWVGGGAPSRKLKYFRDQPLLHPGVTDQHLLLWYFEDWLKKFFFSTLSLDPLSYVRIQTISLIYNLLREKPEQEHNLLRLLVNKLGDSEKSICSRASYHLLQLLQAHPSMKGVIVREMTSLILRPTSSTIATAPPTTNTHIRFTDEPGPSTSSPMTKPKPKVNQEKNAGNDHARYYSTITFNQVVFGTNDKDIAIQVIDVYFQMFKDLLGEGQVSGMEDDTVKKDESKNVEGQSLKGEKDKGAARDKGEGKRGSSKKKRKTEKEIVGDGGFAEVEDTKSKLISAILSGVNRALPYAKLSASDVGLNKHIDTLFLITHTSTFNISLQALVLIQQIASSLSVSTQSSPSSLAKSITNRYYRTLYSSLHDTRLASSSKQTMYLNLLFKSLKGDNDSERVKAFVRRFVQILVSGGAGGPEFIVGGLYLLGELFSTVPGLRDLLQYSTPTSSDDDTYDPRKRDPQFSHPSSTPFYELLPLVNHFHPTVSLHARQLIAAQPISSSADLSLNTLSHFLDRFVYKNPKKSKPKGASAMQPAASAYDGTGVKRVKGEANSGALVNNEKFWKKKETDVAVDEIFFHKFFSKKNEKEKKSSKKAQASEDVDSSEDEKGSDQPEDEDEDEKSVSEDERISTRDDDDEEDSDAEEAEIWKAMKATIPPVAGDEDLLDDSESDEIPSGLDDDEGDGSIDDGESGEDDEEESADGLSLVEDSDNDDLIALDEIPQGLIEFDGTDSENGGDDEEEEWGGISAGDQGKRKREDESRGSKRKKLRSLPTFASYDDYAKMIEDAPEDDI
ncbi:ribosome biogenesis protein, partial [Hygrophoropsis aurantiaca]